MDHTNSSTLFSEAKEFIPGGVNSPVRAFKSVHNLPPFIKKGEGAYLIDEDDNRYVDYVQSWGPLIFGHCDKEIESSVIGAVKNGLSFGAPTKVETKLAKELLELFSFLEKVRFVSSGTEATMSAIRLARGVTKRDKIIKFEGCYHGHSDSLLVNAGSGAATFGTPSSPGVPESFSSQTLVALYNDINSVKAYFDAYDDIACVIIEPIAGNMNLIPATQTFLSELALLCQANGTFLILDEVMSGFRAGLRGSYDHYGIEADIITFGKVIGAGMPVGAFAGKKEIMQSLSPEGPVYQAGTLSGNPVAIHAGLTALKKLKSDTSLYEKLETKAKKLTQGLESVAKKHHIAFHTEVRGSMFGLFFSESKPSNFQEATQANAERFNAFHKSMLEKGFYFAPSLYEAGFISTAITDEMIDQTVEAFDQTLKEINGG